MGALPWVGWIGQIDGFANPRVVVLVLFRARLHVGPLLLSLAVLSTLLGVHGFAQIRAWRLGGRCCLLHLQGAYLGSWFS